MEGVDPPGLPDDPKGGTDGDDLIAPPPPGGGGPGDPPIEIEEDPEDEFGFGEVEELPLFATDEARELHAEIQKHKDQIEGHVDEVGEQKKRLAIMDEHLKNVFQEVQHTTALVNAKKKEIETEDHLSQLTIREAGRYQQELSRLQEASEQTDDKLNMAQNNIFRGNEKMDQFKLEMNWNQEELEQWALAAKQKEDDNLALQRYTRADELKIKELNLQIEKLTKEVIESKARLENEATETQARQIELDRTAEEFRALHADRQKLVQQWQDTIEAMRRRDGTIQELATQYAEERRKHSEKMEHLQQQREHLKGIEDDNADVEAKSTLLERQVQKRREDLLLSQTKHQEFTDELEVLKNELASSATALMKKRNDNTTTAKVLEEKHLALEDVRKQYQAVKASLESEVGATLDAEASAKEAERLLQAEELAVKKNEANLQTLKDTMFRQSQQLFGLRQEEANLIAEISGAQAASRNLQSKIRQLDQESMRQQELIYNAEFQIQQMERKVARGLGERSDEEKKKLNAEIAVLEAELEGAKDKRKMLVTQCRKLNNELRGAQRKKEDSIKIQAELGARITELELENASEEQSLAALSSQKEKLMVQNDVMRLEVKRLRDTLNSRADRVFGLENRQQQLALSMEERKQEIAVHQDVQKAQLRAAEEEKHRIMVELGGRRQAVEKLRDKYETLVKVSGVRDDEGGGEPKSQAFYLIQAAQRREELQREGDDLDQAIRKAEKETRAMDHTLKHLNDKNGAFRMSHQKADMSREEQDRIRSFEEQSKLAQDALFKKKKELQRLQTDFEEDSRRLEQVQQQAQRLDDRAQHLENAQKQMESELEAQKDMVDKTTRRVHRMSGSHREKQGSMEETLQEKQFRVESTQESTQNVLYTLGQLAKEYPETKDVLQVLLQSMSLSIPARPVGRPAQGTTGGERPLSARSDLSSRSGNRSGEAQGR